MHYSQLEPLDVSVWELDKGQPVSQIAEEIEVTPKIALRMARIVHSSQREV